MVRKEWVNTPRMERDYYFMGNALLKSKIEAIKSRQRLQFTMPTRKQDLRVKLASLLANEATATDEIEADDPLMIEVLNRAFMKPLTGEAKSFQGLAIAMNGHLCCN